MTHWLHTSRLGIAGILAASLLAACSLSPSASLPVPEAGPASTPAPIGGAPTARDGLDARLLDGADRRSRSDENRNIYASWYTLDEEPEFGQGQERFVEQEIAAYGQGLAADAFSGVAPPELNVDSALTGASARMVGVRQTTYTFLGASGGSSYRTLWYDREDRATLSTRDLFDGDDAWEQFRGLAADGLASNPDVFPDQAADPDAGLLDSVNFDSSGNALVEFDDYSVAPGSASPVVSKVDADELLPLLNRRGLAVRSAGMEPELPARPAPAPGPGGSTAGPSVAARKAPDCERVKCIALTFDDGPGPSTPRLLAMLEEHEARATFFVVGPNAERYPGVLKQAAAAGHEIGNHTWSHRSLTALTPEQARRELGRTDDAITAATGSAPTLTRPPYGATNAQVNRLVHTPVALWDVDTLDWKHRDADAVATAALHGAHPGAIVLMHDIHATTVAAMPRLLDGLEARGYHFVTVSELLASTNPKAQVTYSHGPVGK